MQNNAQAADQLYLKQKAKILIGFIQSCVLKGQALQIFQLRRDLKIVDGIFQTMKAMIIRQLIQKQRLLGNDDADTILFNTVQEQVEELNLAI